MLDFKRVHKFLIIVLLLPITGCGRDTSCQLKSPGYNILPAENPISEKWGNYLYQNLSKRTQESNIVHHQKKADKFDNIKVEVNKSLTYDYCIENNGEEVALRAKNEKTICWLIYQYIKQLSEEDERIDGDDLPPSILTFTSHCKNFDFEYREPYFLPNLQDDYSLIIGSNNVESDWAIWGHNLGKAFHKDSKDSIYAKQGAWIDYNQYCFSSKETFNQLKKYITDNFGNSEEYSQRFMIMPNDNEISCTCDKCKSIGNTNNNATPAVSYLIKQLSQEFSYHTFFTTAYLTTKQAPKEKWPSNTGVMISTIDIPKGISLSHQSSVREFAGILNSWKECTSKIYIWDYAANFDDYLTPIPILYGLQDQLKFYKSIGIKGVFLNASGYDYSPFDDVKTFVANAIMMDNDLSVDNLCYKYFTENYPTTGKSLCSYYLSLEKQLQKSRKPYNIYGSYDNALNSYLNIKDFIALYNYLGTFMEHADSNEKTKLEKLYTALSYSRLQLAYTQINDDFGYATIKDKTLLIKPDVRNFLYQLSKHKNYNDLTQYKEVGGELEYYIKCWHNLIEKSPFQNLLIGEPIKALSKLDEDYNRIDMLNDGALGLSTDYHHGWFLSSIDDLHIQFDATNLKNAKTLSIRFLIDERHNIYSPEKIEIYKDGILYKEEFSNKKNKKEKLGTTIATINLEILDSEVVSIKMYRKKANRSIIACDEIQLN